MKASIRNKLDTLSERLEEINALLSDPDTIANNNRFRELSQEYSQLTDVVNCYNNYRTAEADVATAEEMLNDDDGDLHDPAVPRRRGQGGLVLGLALLLCRDHRYDVGLERRGSSAGVQRLHRAERHVPRGHDYGHRAPLGFDHAVDLATAHLAHRHAESRSSGARQQWQRRRLGQALPAGRYVPGICPDRRS